jgi:hypothetical protein
MEIALSSDEEMNSDIIFIESENESEKINNSSSSEVKNIHKFT